VVGADPEEAIPGTATKPLRSRRSTNRVLLPKHPVILHYPWALYLLGVEQAFGHHPGPMGFAHTRSAVTIFNRDPPLVSNRSPDVVE
jgi:hypothetical protein